MALEIESGIEEVLPLEMVKKLDDVTDCFLQGAAWVAWELNRVQLLRGCGMDGEGNGEGKGGDGLVEVDEGLVLRMVEGVRE